MKKDIRSPSDLTCHRGDQAIGDKVSRQDDVRLYLLSYGKRSIKKAQCTMAVFGYVPRDILLRSVNPHVRMRGYG